MAKRRRKINTKVARKHLKKHEEGPALFIPAGILTGFGFVFVGELNPVEDASYFELQGG